MDQQFVVGSNNCIAHKKIIETKKGFPSGSDGKESAYNAGNPGSIPGLGRSPGEGNGNPLQCSCVENSMHREVWQGLWGDKESDTTERLTLSLS